MPENEPHEQPANAPDSIQPPSQHDDDPSIPDPEVESPPSAKYTESFEGGNHSED